jgi:putative ABC transport system permease protein
LFLERVVEIFFLGVKNLMRNKLRSFLTMLGMIFGVGSVVAMLSVGAGARHEILSRIQELGIRNIIVNSVRPPEEGRNDATEDENYIDHYGLTFRDEDLIRDTCPTVTGVMPVNLVKQRVWYGSNRVQASVLGVLPEHLTMFGLDVSRGRTFNHIDTATEAKVCIVRRGLVKHLNAVVDPIGMTVKIGSFPFEVIGVLEDEQFRSHTRKALAIDDRAQEVYIPYTTSMRTFGTLTFIERGGSADRSVVELDQIIVMARNAELVRPTSRMVAAVLKALHKKQDYEIVVPLELLEQSEKTQAVFNVVMVLIAAISLIVGGIGIANIMLATITERTKEIGVRRALGARRGDIMLQFLTETAAIGVIGGLFGCLFGLAAIEGLKQFSGWNALVEPYYFGISLGISCAVAILSGIYPARRASRMDPITALRYE